MGNIGTKRIYDAPAKTDGFRVLVDRVWPRGVTKERAAVDLWITAVGGSSWREPRCAVASLTAVKGRRVP